MNQISILNKMSTYLEKGISFEMVKKENGKISIHTHRSISDALDVFEKGQTEIDEEIGQFLVDNILDPELSQQVRNLAFKTAQLFQKKRLNSYNWCNRTQELSKISKQITGFESAKKISKNLNISEEILIEDRSLMNFIIQNHLHNRIDETYIQRGFGPRVENGKVLFPVNNGSSYNSNDVQWMHWDTIPVDRKGKITLGFGPFGFEKINPETPREVHPIKLVNMGMDDAPADKVIVELVTSLPANSLVLMAKKVFRGGPGHSWIRVYEPKISEDGEYNGERFMSSFGVRTPSHKIYSPDIREFMSDKKHCARVEISKENWLKLKEEIETIQQAFLTRQMSAETRKTYESFRSGTCVNFASYIFFKAYTQANPAQPLSLDSCTLPQKCFLRPIANSIIGNVVRRLTPDFISSKIRWIFNGYMPWELMKNLNHSQKKYGFSVQMTKS